ncbi:non-muscle caldesmon-like isoform X2 [Arapaima gigas]
MASAIIRRNSSKQGLQNLLRVTAQRSMEDAEEIERERRRRARESIRQHSSQLSTEEISQDGESLADDSLYESKLKPSYPSALEEDEGFSDWTQKLERHRQRRLEEQNQVEEDEGWRQQRYRDEEEELARRENERRRTRKEQEEEEERQEELRKQQEREQEVEERRMIKKREEEQRNVEEKPNEKRKEIKVSYTSKVFLQQEARHIHANGDAGGVEVTPLVKTKRSPSSLNQAQERDEEAEVFLETEQRLEKIRRSHQEKESQELEQLRQRQAEAEAELEELKKRREERRRIREEEERRREAEEHQRLMKEEEEKKRMKEDIERRRMEAAERRMKTLSISSNEGDEAFCPLSPKSPTFKITERTESLNRSLKKSNSIKKTQPPLLVTKIDDRLEQYSHAIETSTKEPKGAKQVVMDIPNPSEPVASKKNLFEAGEARNQNSFKGTPSKARDTGDRCDTEGLKVGVADRITQWVKGNVDGSNRSPHSKPTDVKAGDVLHKKNMWENIGDTSSSGKWTPGAKGTPSGKRYKFVVTGHGKYEKIAVSDDNYSEYTNGKSADLYHGES